MHTDSKLVKKDRRDQWAISFTKKLVYHETNTFRGVRWKISRNKYGDLKRKSSFSVGNFSGGKVCFMFEFLEGFLNLRIFTAISVPPS